MKFKSLIKKKNYKRGFLFTLIGILALSNLYAQNSGTINVKGTVIDDVTKETVVGASVLIKGTQTATMTDLNGGFELNAPSDGTLVITFIGFKAQEVPIKNKTSHTIYLTEDAGVLDEVIVIGYGQVKKGDATGAISAITPDELNRGMQVTAEDALIGKIAGVNIVPGSGAPGSGGTIRIRMGASLSATNDPLIVIDGIPVSDISISSINPNDIESFTVLKDASSTAIYGSRASNGVVIITTKKGKATANGMPRITYSANFSMSEVVEKLDVLSADEFRTAFALHGGAAPGFQLGTHAIDWQDKIYQTAFGTDHNLSVVGAIKGMPYRISVGYLNQDGIIKENNYERFNGGVGFSPKFFDDHLSLDINVKGSIEDNRPVSTGVVGGAALFDPSRPIYESYPNDMGLGYYMWMNGGVPITLAPVNPLAELKLTNKKDKIKRSIGNMAIDYKIHGLEDLRVNLNMGYDVKTSNYDEYVPDKAPSMYVSNKSDGTGKAYSSTNRSRNYLLDLYANYKKEFAKKHTIDAMAGYGWQHFWDEAMTATNDTQGNQIKESTYHEKELYLLSFYGRLNYSFNSKILFTSTLRGDASSRFAKNKRWGYFPSTALAYRISEEDFMKNIKPLSDLKLRVSYGQTGQQGIGGYYEHLPRYTISQDDSRYQFGNDWISLYRPDGYDPNIKWETTTTYNFGLDYGFLNNRIYGSLDVYTRKTKDLLSYIDVPAGSNFTNRIRTNIGHMKSKGVEVAATAIPVKTKDFEWSISGNFTWNTAEITKLNTIDTDENAIQTGSAGGTGKYLQVHKVGETPNTFFLLKQAYDTDGKALDGKYIAKDGSITTSEQQENKYLKGSSRVPFFYGLSSRLNYKNWDLGINGHGSFGSYIYNYQAAKGSFDSFYSSTGVSNNILKSTLKNGFLQERIYTDHFLEKGNFFKIDNITLGYKFDKLWNTSSSLRLAFSVQNIYTITSYSGLDPEIYNGIDNNVYQRPRQYTFSLNLNF